MNRASSTLFCFGLRVSIECLIITGEQNKFDSFSGLFIYSLAVRRYPNLRCVFLSDVKGVAYVSFFQGF